MARTRRTKPKPMTVEDFARLKAMGLRHIAERAAAATSLPCSTIGTTETQTAAAGILSDVGGCPASRFFAKPQALPFTI